MPGAPNRPPETAAEAPPTQPGDAATRKALRRLAPARIALRLDIWKGAPGPDVLTPFERAEALFQSGDLVGAESALDQLSVRLAEPRWPTLPSPWRQLRVNIPAPQPPQWDPEFNLSPAEKEQKKLEREADKHLALLAAGVEWARAHEIEIDDVPSEVDRAKSTHAASGPDEAFWGIVDASWSKLRARIPPPSRPAVKPPVAPSVAESVEEA